jgi:hypothetical protein
VVAITNGVLPLRKNVIQTFAIMGFVAFGVSTSQAGPGTIVGLNVTCNLATVQKPDEFGLVTLFSPNAVSIGDKVEGDFDSIKYMRKARNETTGKDIMIRGVRYSTSRRIVELEIPPECKEAPAAAMPPAQ